jgi:hypothetical protein
VLDITGGEDFARVAKRLKDAGDRELTRELNKAVREAMAPARRAMEQSLDQNLPHRGGFDRKLRGEVKFRIVRRANGLRLTTSHRYQLRLIDQGRVRHPLFADRGHWYTTTIEPGVLTKPFEENADQARQKIGEATDRVARKIAR